MKSAKFLALIFGVSGGMVRLYAFSAEGIAGAVQEIFGTSIIIALFFLAFLGIFAAILAIWRSVLSGFLMVLSGLGGLMPFSALYFISGLLFIIGAISAFASGLSESTGEIEPRRR